MIYNISDKPPISRLLLFSLQMLLSVFTATALIAQVCGVNMGGAMIGAGVATIVYALCTHFKSPMYISNSGAFVAPVLAAMAMGGYTAVAIGGVVSSLVYCIFGFIFSKVSVDNIYKVFPKVLIGSITVVIGVNLMAFIPSYIGDSQVGVWVALFTMLVIALASCYLKGTLSLFPFLIGTLAGYIVSIPLGLVDFSVFDGVEFFQVPTFAFTQWSTMNWGLIGSVVVLYISYTISAMMKCLSDHAALGGIIGKDLYRKPGLSKVFIGEGIANIATSWLGGLGACSYGEGIACVGFSKCASIYTTIGAAIMMILLGFIGPVQAFIASIPSCVIGGGTAIILYGFIANSGIKQLQQVDFSNSKNLIISSLVMSIGICGTTVILGPVSLSATALALVVGILVNILLNIKKKEGN